MQCAKTRVLVGALALVGFAGCETYELPPRLVGVATEDCSDCEVLALSESLLPPGMATMTAVFSFEDEWGALSELRVFVTAPSGLVVPVNGMPCDFVIDLPEQVGAEECVVTALRFRDSGDTVFARLRGIEAGELATRFGLQLDEVGTWSVEVWATRDTGATSNRLLGTFEVVEPRSADPE